MIYVCVHVYVCTCVCVRVRICENKKNIAVNQEKERLQLLLQDNRVASKRNEPHLKNLFNF